LIKEFGRMPQSSKKGSDAWQPTTPSKEQYGESSLNAQKSKKRQKRKVVDEWKLNVEECLYDQTSSDAWVKDRRLEDKNAASEPIEVQSSSCALSSWTNGTEHAAWFRHDDSRWSSSKREEGGWNAIDGSRSKAYKGQSNGRYSNWDAWDHPKEPCAVKDSGEISEELPVAKAPEIQQQSVTENGRPET